MKYLSACLLLMGMGCAFGFMLDDCHIDNFDLYSKNEHRLANTPLTHEIIQFDVSQCDNVEDKVKNHFNTCNFVLCKDGDCTQSRDLFPRPCEKRIILISSFFTPKHVRKTTYYMSYTQFGFIQDKDTTHVIIQGLGIYA